MILINPWIQRPGYPLYLPSENLGLGYLASFLRKHSVSVEIIDANMQELSASQVVRRVASNGPAVIGISLAAEHVKEVAELARALKASLPDVHITVGGRFATLSHMSILQCHCCIDSVVRGDGELTLLDLVRTLERGLGLDGVLGLSFRGPDGQPCVNERRFPLANLDQLPWPARDTLSYVQTLGHNWATQLSTSRGCYGQCSFCDVPVIYNGCWRARSERDVIEEIRWLRQEYGVSLIRLTDDDFIGAGQNGCRRASRLARMLVQEGLDIQLMIAAQANRVEYDLFALLHEAGVVDCLVGVESGVDRILGLYRKGTTVRQNLRAIETLRRIGIRLNLAFIMFDPRMTLTELQKNYVFLESNGLLTVDALRSRLWPLDGTSVSNELRTTTKVFEGGKQSSWALDAYQDAAVADVLEIVRKCSMLTYDLDLEIYAGLKFGALAEFQVEQLQSNNLELWKTIFRNAIEDPICFDFEWVAKESSQLRAQVSTMASANQSKE